MSMKAIVCSSSWTISAGSSPATILQKRQSPVSSGIAGSSLQPADALEVAVQRGADDRHRQKRGGVAELPAELRHVVEVHPVDAGYRGGHGDDRDPGGDAPHVLVLAHADLGEVGLQRAREQVAHGVELVAGADEVVVHVPEVLADLG